MGCVKLLCQELGISFATLNFLAKYPVLPGSALKLSPKTLSQMSQCFWRAEPGEAAVTRRTFTKRAKPPSPSRGGRGKSNPLTDR